MGVLNAVIDAIILLTAEVVGLTVIVTTLEGQENVEQAEYESVGLLMDRVEDNEWVGVSVTLAEIDNVGVLGGVTEAVEESEPDALIVLQIDCDVVLEMTLV